MDPKSTKKRPKVNPKIEAAKNMFSDAFFNDFTWFVASFSNQNQREFLPRVKYVEKRKTFQNIAWASKNQGLASPTWTKNAKNRVKIAANKKTSKSCWIFAVFGASRARLGGQKREICEHFVKVFEASKKLACSYPAPCRKPSQGGGPWRFSTVSLVFQSIRSALSVSLSLCWCASRRPNPFGKFFKGTQLVGKRSNMDLKTNQAKLLFPDAITDVVFWNFTKFQLLLIFLLTSAKSQKSDP